MIVEEKKTSERLVRVPETGAEELPPALLDPIPEQSLWS